jgi:hypothetical protein
MIEGIDGLPDIAKANEIVKRYEKLIENLATIIERQHIAAGSEGYFDPRENAREILKAIRNVKL